MKRLPGFPPHELAMFGFEEPIEQIAFERVNGETLIVLLPPYHHRLAIFDGYGHDNIEIEPGDIDNLMEALTEAKQRFAQRLPAAVPAADVDQAAPIRNIYCESGRLSPPLSGDCAGAIISGVGVRTFCRRHAAMYGYWLTGATL